MDFPIDIDTIASGKMSDRTLRGLIRLGLAGDLRRRGSAGIEAQLRDKLELVRLLERSPIAVQADAANHQHYEVPTEFFRMVLGLRLKYSACYFPPGVDDLDAAEEAMLALVCERAGVDDGQEILDLGCGWGSLSLYLARRFPGSRILGVSNSRTQKACIDARIAELGLSNLEIQTADVTTWDAPRPFDRIISVEMLEHMRNYAALLARIAAWLRPEGRFFAHIFAHLRFAYVVADNWLADAFFTGGIMPSDDLLLYFQGALRVTDHWRVSGLHYQRTSELWLQRLDRERERVLALFAGDVGDEEALRMFVRWRLFFLVTAESFGFANGEEWFVSHYLMEKPR